MIFNCQNIREAFSASGVLDDAIAPMRELFLCVVSIFWV